MYESQLLDNVERLIEESFDDYRISDFSTVLSLIRTWNEATGYEQSLIFPSLSVSCSQCEKGEDIQAVFDILPRDITAVSRYLRMKQVSQFKGIREHVLIYPDNRYVELYIPRSDQHWSAYFFGPDHNYMSMVSLPITIDINQNYRDVLSL